MLKIFNLEFHAGKQINKKLESGEAKTMDEAERGFEVIKNNGWRCRVVNAITGEVILANNM